MDMRVAAYAVIERRGSILLTHWRRGRMHGWTLPGGGIENGEDPQQTVVREVLEETGLTAKTGKLLGVDSRVMIREEVEDGQDPQLHTIRIVYRATVADGPLRHEVDGSSDEARWVPIREIRSLKTLSLVQTGLRMAGISLRSSNGRSGSRRSRRSGGGSGNGAAVAGTGGSQPKKAAADPQRSGESAPKGAATKSSAPQSSGQKSGAARSGPRRAQKTGGSRTAEPTRKSDSATD
ncbi:NUDIX hydrolase [Leucobacter iarius]|uniref:Nudix hydrolase domain-containing protein n=1 Tax=Leucobacter iarius TaxID=333963 RepID=A0ABN2L863_9MICO